mgnify:CR=1 FL=1
MRIVLAFTDSHARSMEYFLRRRYDRKSKLAKLCRIAIFREVAAEAEKEMKEAEAKI